MISQASQTQNSTVPPSEDKNAKKIMTGEGEQPIAKCCNNMERAGTDMKNRNKSS